MRSYYCNNLLDLIVSRIENILNSNTNTKNTVITNQSEIFSNSNFALAKVGLVVVSRTS